jgi:hypothetical protein
MNAVFAPSGREGNPVDRRERDWGAPISEISHPIRRSDVDPFRTRL